jgi:predicted SnoaL-like aldol condensation-catalyzing enzyme
MNWKPIETAPRDETEILIKTNIGVVSAWFHSEPGECYQWVCYDDAFTIDGDCKSVTHWMPIPTENARTRRARSRTTSNNT